MVKEGREKERVDPLVEKIKSPEQALGVLSQVNELGPILVETFRKHVDQSKLVHYVRTLIGSESLSLNGQKEIIRVEGPVKTEDNLQGEVPWISIGKHFERLKVVVAPRRVVLQRYASDFIALVGRRPVDGTLSFEVMGFHSQVDSLQYHELTANFWKDLTSSVARLLKDPVLAKVAVKAIPNPS